MSAVPARTTRAPSSASPSRRRWRRTEAGSSHRPRRSSPPTRWGRCCWPRAARARCWRRGAAGGGSPHARTAAVGALAASGILWLSADSHGTGTPALRNPFAGDSASVERGRALYATSCVGCHGAHGLGDGPDAAGLVPAPADLSLHVPLHPESDTYVFIAQGFPGTAMPGWAEELSDEQIWDLVSYLRDEFDGGVPGATRSR